MPSPTTLVSTPLPGGGSCELDAADGRTLVLHLSRAPKPLRRASYAVARESWPAAEASVEQAGAGWKVTTPWLTVELRADPFHLRITDSAGGVRFETTAENALEFRGRGIVLRRTLAAGEAIYGLGEHGETFNRVPGRHRIWNRDEAHHHPFRQYYCTIPFGIAHPGGAQLGHGFLIDNPGELFIDCGRTDPAAVEFDCRTGDLVLWLLLEDTPARILEEYTALTGRMERPPLWALGYQQCRWSYPTEARIREVCAEFRRRRIPCDVVYCDIDYMEKYRVFTWSAERFPDPAGMLRDLAADGFSTVTIVDPGVAQADDSEYAIVAEGRQLDGFFLRRPDGSLVDEDVWPGAVYFPDFTSAANRAKWGEWQAAALLDAGIAGIWNDMNEPAVWGKKTGTGEMYLDAIHHDHGQFRPHQEVHNVYGLTMAQASCEGQLTHRPGARPFTLTRSGWAGIQRWSAVWTGDNRAAFSTMPLDIALNLNMAMSGVAFVGCDIGGFANDATPELFARWIEWGALQPFCRGHAAHGTIDQEPWSFGPEVEKIARRMLELRYQLLPYIYSLFVEASETGAPVNRPLVFEHPHDATVASIGDQFMLGSDLLAAPILTAGVNHRAVYLPAGEWVHFWSEKRHAGGRWILAEAQLGRPPLFARAGAVIPMGPVRQHTKESPPDVTYLDVFPAERLSGRLVEDDGATFAFRDGDECVTVFSGGETASALKLLIGAPQGRHRPARQQWHVRLHRSDRRAAAVTLNGEPVPFEQTSSLITFTLPAAPRELKVVVDYAG